MVIQWYPGHMSKALKMMEKEIKVVDAIIYVLDARAPFSCVNPKLNKIIGEKPIIYVLNKADMADDKKIIEWQKYFTTNKSICIILNSVLSGSGKKIENALNIACKLKIERNKNKGINTTLRAMVLGVPNSGKSTLINNLCGKSKTVTGNKAGVTRGKQWVRIASGIELLDTPGTLWPSFENNFVAQHLAYIGSIKEEVLDIPELAISFIKEMLEIDKSVIEKRYSIIISQSNTYLEILEKICLSRGYLLKGNELDFDRGSLALINDFKSGKLGKITLESTADIKKLIKKNREVED